MRAPVLLLFFAMPLCLFASVLQDVIDRAEPGSMIELPPGRFSAPLVIGKPLILKGAGSSTVIDGNGSSTLLVIRAADVSVRDLRLTGGGRQRYSLDAAVDAQNADRLHIERCRIDHTLFGIRVENSRDIRIADNNISSWSERVTDNRGDGIRLYNTDSAVILRNHISQSRDLAVSRCRHVRIENNRVEKSRYGLLLQMVSNVTVRHNTLVSDTAGIFCKGAKDTVIEYNRIADSHGMTGVGLLLMHGRHLTVRYNTVVRNTQGIYIDSKPAEEGMQRFILGNEIALNNEAFHFHAIIKNNVVHGNNIVRNLDDVVVNRQGAATNENNISGNYWDHYRGFDRDHDGIGDTPYRVLVYSDRLWMFDHHLKFFYASPLLSLIGFIEKIAPFTEPLLLIEDPKPSRKPFELSGNDYF